MKNKLQNSTKDCLPRQHQKFFKTFVIKYSDIALGNSPTRHEGFTLQREFRYGIKYNFICSEYIQIENKFNFSFIE